MITIEIKKQQEEEKQIKIKDIFFQGNIVTNGWRVITVSGNGIEENEFSGQVMDVKDMRHGQHRHDFKKSDFTQFTGTITITSK